jgi:hypothetical protein
MKVFRELSAYGEPGALESMLATIESGLCDGWLRDRESEARAPVLCGEGKVWIFFLREARDESPEIALAITLEGRRLTIANVFPTQPGQISREQYNSFVSEFFLKFLQPAAQDCGVEVSLSSDERTIEEAFGWNAVGLLTSFSKCANKKMTHPADRNRWFDFLVSLHGRRVSEEDLDVLAEWLLEDGWSTEKVEKMVSECELASEVLRAIDRNGLFERLLQPITYNQQESESPHFMRRRE